eukprot:TRINITY_DN3506_c0_g1_i3.p1 TRINITY_DN3506_c0_g1~~TRINITY_DN3506_c0_g1_i3.p1  ORF type:complete len:377 (-),score=34.06 TRINITY_DN3506_c0_g1_i3:8-1138(-)
MGVRTYKWQNSCRDRGHIMCSKVNERQTKTCWRQIVRFRDVIRFKRRQNQLGRICCCLQQYQAEKLCLQRHGISPQDVDQVMQAIMCAPFAAINFQEALTSLRSSFRKIYDKVYFGDMLPPVGSLRLSYSRFMQLMHDRMVKRVYIMGEGRMALVEVPVTGWASDYDTQRFDRRNPEIMYCQERPEWQMEKWRFYVELPGDFWTESDFMVYFKKNLPHRTREDRVKYEWMLQEHQVVPELVVVDPGDNLIWLNQFSGQLLPIFGLVILRLLVGAGSWVGRLFGLEKKDKETQMAEQFQKHRATAYGVEEMEGGKKKKRDTGVRFSDVAGIDMVVDDIREIISMLMGGGHDLRSEDARIGQPQTLSIQFIDRCEESS